VQLTHACLALGYDAVIPASWGDELIAGRVVERLREARGPMVQCSCPLVSGRLARNADAIAPMLMCLVSPPVATASYLRALYAPARPRITYAGACPAGSDDSIDVAMSPADLLALLAARNISIAAQPREFDSMLAPDRRRFLSDPGGVPGPSALRHLDPPVELVELSGENLVMELAQELLEPAPALIDFAAAVGCACSGATTGPESGRAARARVREHEPPRAPGPVLEAHVRVALDGEVPDAGTDAAEPAAPTGDPPVTAPVAVGARDEPAAATNRRRTPSGSRRSVLGGMPQARADAGRQLPRAYVARRRSSPRGLRATRARAEIGAVVAGHWPWIAAAGVAIGVLLAWLVGLAG